MVLAYAWLFAITLHVKIWLLGLLLVVSAVYCCYPYGLIQSKVKRARVRRVLRTKTSAVAMALFISCSCCPSFACLLISPYHRSVDAGGHCADTCLESVNRRDIICYSQIQSVDKHFGCWCKAPFEACEPIRGLFCCCSGTYFGDSDILSRTSPDPVLWDVFVPCKGFKGEGPLTLVSANVTSCVKHFERIATFDAHVSTEGGASCIFLQESRIPLSKVSNMTRRFEKKGWKLNAGPQPSTRRLRGKLAKYRQPTGGLAIVSKPSCTTVPVSIPDSFPSIHECCQAVWVSVGCFGVYVFNLYLPTGAAAAAERNDLMDHVFNFAASLGRQPILLCGDFQSPPEANTSIVNSFIADEWFDVYAEQQHVLGLQVEHTFQKSGSSHLNTGLGKTRIDYFLLNRYALPLFQSASVLRDTGFPNHSPTAITLNLESFRTNILVVKPSPKWSFGALPRKDCEWESRDAIVKPLLEAYLPSLLQHAERLDVEALWATACEAVTSMINTVADNSVPSTRGSIPEFRQAPLFKDGKRKRARCNFTTALKLIHEIRNKAKVWHQSVSPEWTSQLFATIFNASKVAAKCGVSASLNASSSLELQASCTSLQEELIRKLEACETVRSQELIDQWKHKIKLSARGNRSRVHRWLKGERVGQPRFFRREDGSITSDPNEMLEMISEHMETIYNFHADKDVDQMEAEFYEKYHEAMDKIATDADIPAIHHVDLFKMFKKKSSCKASGLDGWKVAELQHLPPSGWIPFALVMKVAEATGVWPAALRLVSIASISKGVDMSSPKNIRCIGIASVIYSLWSSLRFRRLMQWQAAVFPPSLIGGISARSGDDSEWLLSMDLHNDHSDTMALFLDRFKCFDLVIPQVSLGIARRLGLPEHVYRAALGFYSNQTKFFKLGSAFGRRVLASNSAVQGCSVSIVMINSAYAVFATVLNNVCPSISFRSFIDDAKFWTPENNRGELANALSCVEQFDQSIGQVLNPEKTTLLTKRQAKADRFLREVGRQSFRRKKTVKSLGYTQSCRLKGSVSIQNERAAKACQMLRKIAVLLWLVYLRRTLFGAPF